MVRRTVVGLIALLFALSPVAGFAGTGFCIKNCCDFANSISAEVADLASETQFELGGSVSAARLGQLLKALAKTQENLSLGVTGGGDTCDGKKSASKFQYAKGFLTNYREILASIGLEASGLDSWAAFLEGEIMALIAGECADGSGSGSGSG